MTIDFVTKLKKAARIPSDYKDRLGNCYELAARCITANIPNADMMVLEHGSIYHPMFSTNGPLFHAWVVLPDSSRYDPVADQVLSAELHSALFQPEVFARYTQQQALIEMLSSEHWGPWDDALYDESNLIRKGGDAP